MREYLLWVLAMHRDPTLGHTARIYWESDFVLARRHEVNVQATTDVPWQSIQLAACTQHVFRDVSFLPEYRTGYLVRASMPLDQRSRTCNTCCASCCMPHDGVNPANLDVLSV